MPRKSDIIIPQKCLAEMPGFTKKEWECVIKSMLTLINIKIDRTNHLYIKIRGFGTISTRANRKISKVKYQNAYIHNYWKKKNKEIELTEKKLLY